MTIKTTESLDDGRIVFGEPVIGTFSDPPVGAENPEVDPVCGRELDTSATPPPAHVDHGGRTYFFCSAECQEMFVSDPGTYEVSDPT
jgi:YHS domain-containing protein